jgi:hypothetical protein
VCIITHVYIIYSAPLQQTAIKDVQTGPNVNTLFYENFHDTDFAFFADLQNDDDDIIDEAVH